MMNGTVDQAPPRLLGRSSCAALIALTLSMGVVFTAMAQSSAVGRQGMVATSSPEASAGGAQILKAGGNAVDAAVAVGFALAVTYPEAGNLGGGGFAVVRAPDGAVITLDHRERAPFGATQDMFLDARWLSSDKFESSRPAASKNISWVAPKGARSR